MTALVAAAFAGVAGFLLGMLATARHVDLECERAYLTGHVDGYRKAQDDSGEVPW
jgi:hypothetical protein